MCQGYPPCVQVISKLLLVSNFLSNGLEVQFNVNKCITRGMEGEVVVLGLHEDDLYKMKVTMVHGADAANSAQS